MAQQARNLYITSIKEGIVEKAQETIFGMSPKYSRYIRIAS